MARRISIGGMAAVEIEKSAFGIRNRVGGKKVRHKQDISLL